MVWECFKCHFPYWRNNLLWISWLVGFNRLKYKINPPKHDNAVASSQLHADGKSGEVLSSNKMFLELDVLKCKERKNKWKIHKRIRVKLSLQKIDLKRRHSQHNAFSLPNASASQIRITALLQASWIILDELNDDESFSVVPLIYFCCRAVLLRSSRNILWAAKLHLRLHQQEGE